MLYKIIAERPAKSYIKKGLEAMKRNMRKLVSECEEKFNFGRSGKGEFSADEILQIDAMAKEHPEDYKYHAITYALEAGLMIGYHLAKKEADKA